MAKKFVKGKMKNTDRKFESKYPSEYGSHESMIDENLTSQLLVKFMGEDNLEMVICRDDKGPYLTEKFRASSDYNVGDSNRWTSTEVRIAKVIAALPPGTDLAEVKVEEEKE